MVNDVVKMKYPYCQKVLPLVYDESLSYYEAVCKLVAKMNELVDTINNISVDILNDAKAYTDSAIASQQSAIDEKVLELTALINATVIQFDEKLVALQNQYDAFTRQTNAKITLIDNKVNTFGDKIDADIIGVNARTDLAIQQNNEYIFDVIGSQLLGNIKVVNWFTGEKISVQDMFNYLCIEFHAADSMDYNTMVSRQLTYSQFIALNTNYTNLIVHGKTIYM